MCVLATNWSSAWLMTGLGFGAVFCILVLLVVVLKVFNMLSASTPKRRKSVLKTSDEGCSDLSKGVDGYEEDMAAVATAVHLYLSKQHDNESGVLTIHQDEHSMWHAELNSHL